MDKLPVIGTPREELHLSPDELEAEIKRLKVERNAVILAHYYQESEIQDLADFVGDSLQLSQAAAKTQADVIVFCGVHFMAETAKILNPTKIVVIPDLEAGCSLADGCPAPVFEKWLEQYPGHTVVSYINCSAEVKALSDVICTSSNAVKIVKALGDREDRVRARSPPRRVRREAGEAPGPRAVAGHLHRPRDVQRAPPARADGEAPRRRGDRAPRVPRGHPPPRDPRRVDAAA